MNDGWIQHGDSNQRDLVKMLLPERGVHFMVSDDEGATRALTAELAAMVAGGDLVSMQDGGRNNLRLQRGFMNLPTGKPRAVSVVGATDMDHINVAAALRNINTRLSIYVREDTKCDLAANGFGYKLRENDIALAIVAVDVGEKDGLELVRRYGMFANEATILIVTKSEPPKNLLSRETRVLRIVEGKGEDRLTLTAEGEALKPGWSRNLELEAVDLGDGRVAYGLRSTGDAASVPQFAPAVQEHAPAAPEPYAGTVICWRSVFGLHPLEAARWPEGACFEEQPYEAARAASEIDGRVQVILTLGPESKLDPKEEIRRINTALAQFKIAQRVDVTIAAQKLLDARDARDRVVPAA